MIKFEKVSRLKDADFNLPVRKTANSAGYDMEVAEDIVIPSLFAYKDNIPTLLTLDEAKDIYKKIPGLKPTLVSSGVKCYLNPDTYLELSVRSSTPLKYLLVLANGVGIIDADYADNPDNEGEIFFQLLNLGPSDIKLKKGDIIGQGIIKKFETTDDDMASGKRVGGLGSTTKGE